MPVDARTLAGGVPQYPRAGGVIGNYVISVAGESVAPYQGRFVVANMATDSRTAYQITAPVGYSYKGARHGSVGGGGLWVCFSGIDNASLMWLAKILPSGSVADYPSGKNVGFSQAVYTGSEVWCLRALPRGGYGVTAAVPQIFDLATSTWIDTTALGMAAVDGAAQSVYKPGRIYHWSKDATTYTLYRYNTSTKARTTVATASKGVIDAGQAAEVGNYIYWRSATHSKVLQRLDVTTDTLTEVTVGVDFGYALAYNPVDDALYSPNISGTSVSVHFLPSGPSHSDATGVATGQGAILAFWDGSGENMWTPRWI